MVIWKFELVVGRQSVLMPQGAQLLHVDLQRSCICLWALCDEAATKEDRRITVIGTGDYVPSIEAMYVGTVIDDEEYVWHVFDVK